MLRLQNQHAPSRPGFQPAFDGVRAVAVALVILFHAVALMGGAPRAERMIPGAGNLGVDVFFVLSGLLITTLLVDEADRTGQIAFERFYLRRGLRLLPALALALGVTLVIDYYVDHWPGRNAVRSLLVIGLYIVNWVKTSGADVSPGLGQTWSLAVEEQFYLLWPAVIGYGVIRRRWSPRMWMWALGLGIAALTITRALLWAHGSSLNRLLYGTDMRAAPLLAGAALAIMTRRGVSFRRARPFVVPSIGFLIAVTLFGHAGDAPMNLGGNLVVTVAIAVVIAAVTRGSAAFSPALARPLSAAIVRHLGRISYALYLWHITVINAVTGHLHAPMVVRAVVAVTGSILAAELSMVVVERPFLALKDRCRPAADSDPPEGDRYDGTCAPELSRA